MEEAREVADNHALTETPPRKPFPKAIGFIMVNELCERFSYYGLKAILATYLTDFILYDKDHATEIVHGFIFACYFLPLAGGYLADRYLGKFWTIFILTIVYCIGGGLLAVTAIPGVTGWPPGSWGVILSLVLIAAGTGGIKPCVSSLVGDQFDESQKDLYSIVFPLFYFCINVGSLLSTFITPQMKANLSFAWAFSVPAMLLGISLIIFVAGKRYYVLVPPGENIFTTVFAVLRHGIGGWFSTPRGMRKPMLSYAVDKCGEQTVNDVRAVFHVLKIFLYVNHLSC
eukprot:TRINITY_DN2915_c0_g1_i1.p1 TRINITY_DN2915_c0_g1~~TRINITY_DN2915_c0_g1_i1.p1  ORF type:complete len:286 (+),score=50.86 TRINITY_DN2915_c0_g1_i1:8-865(+)